MLFLPAFDVNGKLRTVQRGEKHGKMQFYTLQIEGNFISSEQALECLRNILQNSSQSNTHRTHIVGPKQ